MINTIKYAKRGDSYVLSPVINDHLITNVYVEQPTPTISNQLWDNLITVGKQVYQQWLTKPSQHDSIFVGLTPNQADYWRNYYANNYQVCVY